VISRSSVNGKHPVRHLGEVVEFLDGQRKPVTESDRKPGPYPYFGANGQQGTIDGFIFDEPLVLLAEDGGHFETPDRGIAYRISGKTWVNNHAHVLRPKPQISLDYLCRVLENYDVTPFVTGTTRGKLTKGGAKEIPIPLPPLPEQRRIAAILDKVEDLRAQRRARWTHIEGLCVLATARSERLGKAIGNADCMPFQVMPFTPPETEAFISTRRSYWRSLE
jgi:type I restriction enzyme S subunit